MCNGQVGLVVGFKTMRVNALRVHAYLKAWDTQQDRYACNIWNTNISRNYKN